MTDLTRDKSAHEIDMPPLTSHLPFSHRQMQAAKSRSQDIELSDFNVDAAYRLALLDGNSSEDLEAADLLPTSRAENLQKPKRRKMRQCAFVLPQKLLKSPRYVLMVLYEPTCFFTSSVLTAV